MPPDATRTPARRRPPARRKGPPSALLVFLPPLLITAGTVGVAAVHTALGAPLGPSFAAEVWSLAKTFVAVSLTYSGFSGFVVANNRRAWAALDGADGSDGADDDGGHVPGAQGGRGAVHAPRPITSRMNPTRPTSGRHAAVTDTMRRRRTGRLTPVESLPAVTITVERKDGAPANAEPAGPGDTTPRQAGGGGPR